MLDLLLITLAMTEDKSTLVQSLGLLLTLVVLLPAFYLAYGVLIGIYALWNHYKPSNRKPPQ